jgi:hypothetical protein
MALVCNMETAREKLITAAIEVARRSAYCCRLIRALHYAVGKQAIWHAGAEGEEFFLL